MYKQICVCTVIADDILPPKQATPSSDLKKRSLVTREVGLSSNVVMKQVFLSGMYHLEAGDMISGYSRTPLIRPPSESHWCGRIRGMVAREGFVYEQKPLSVTQNVVV